MVIQQGYWVLIPPFVRHKNQRKFIEARLQIMPSVLVLHFKGRNYR
jgi:hypothetical protein